MSAQQLTAEQVTTQTAHVVALHATRRTAAAIAERMLAYYEVAYPDDIRLRMVLPTALDYVNGLEGESCLALACEVAGTVFDEANRLAETCDIRKVARYWAAADAAEAVLEVLSPVVDLSAVRRLEGEARKRFTLSRSGT